MASHQDPIALGLDLSKPILPRRGPREALIGRGGGSNNDAATQALRALIDPFKFRYLYAKTDSEKQGIVLECEDVLETEGYRIVGEWNGQFYELTPQGRSKKIKQRSEKEPQNSS